MASNKRQQQFTKMMDSLPEVKNHCMEAELLFDAATKAEVPRLIAQDLDRVRGKRSSVEKCPCCCCPPPPPTEKIKSSLGRVSVDGKTTK